MACILKEIGFYLPKLKVFTVKITGLWCSFRLFTISLKLFYNKSKYLLLKHSGLSISAYSFQLAMA